MTRYLILISLLCFASCRVSREAANSQHSETAQSAIERLSARSVVAPPAHVGLRVPLAELRASADQPATFAAREGKAAITMRLERDTIYLDATCDSLMALVVDYERRLADRAEIRTDERAERHWSSFVSGWIGPFIALFLLIYALWKR